MINPKESIQSAKQLYINKNYQKAISAFKHILEINPNTEECYWYVGICYEKLGWEQKAIEYFKKGLQFCNDVSFISDYHLNIGKNLLMLSQLEEALDCFEKASECKENRLMALFNQAMVYLCKKNYEKAFELFVLVKGTGLNHPYLQEHIEYCKKKLNTM